MSALFDLEMEILKEHLLFQRYQMKTYPGRSPEHSCQQSIKYLKKELDQIGYDVYPQSLEIVGHLLQLLISKGRLEESAKLIDYYLDTKKVDESFYKGTLLRNRAIIMKKRGEREKIIPIFKEAIEHLEVHMKTFPFSYFGDSKQGEYSYDCSREELAVALMELGEVYFDQRRFEESYPVTKLSLEEFHKRKPEYVSVSVCLCILFPLTLRFSSICLELKRGDNEALFYKLRYLKLLTFKPDCKSVYNYQVGTILEGIAARFYNNGYPKNSLSLLHRVLELYSKREINRRVSVLSTICLIYFRLGNFRKFFATKKKIPTRKMINRKLKSYGNVDFQDLEDKFKKVKGLEKTLKMVPRPISLEKWRNAHLGKWLMKRNGKPCSFCGKVKKALKKCSVCGLFSYCSKDCQFKDWKNGHKDCCVDLWMI